MPRIVLFLKQQEDDALSKLAESEYRDPRSQAAHILRSELQRRGLIESSPIRELNDKINVEPQTTP